MSLSSDFYQASCEIGGFYVKEVKMRGKKLLAAFLLGMGLCFVPAIGQAFVPGK